MVSRVRHNDLLKKIADNEGEEVNAVLARAAFDSVVPGICLSCEAVEPEIEPDQDAGYCDECGKNRVVSCLRLAGWI
jgi:hypothetical protein